MSTSDEVAGEIEKIMLPFTVWNFVDKIENVPMVSIACRDDDRSTWDKDAREGELWNNNRDSYLKNF